MNANIIQNENELVIEIEELEQKVAPSGALGHKVWIEE
jgi:hypothetical protein